MKKPMGFPGWRMGLATMACALSSPLYAQDDQASDVAKKLANPVASMISVPVQYNHDRYSGPNEGATVSTVVFQPVIPFSLNRDWNLITRTLIPLIDNQNFPAGAMNQSGLGDISASFFFSPKAPTSGGLIWGVGPAALLPTAAHDALGTGKFGLGPTAVLLKQSGPWTIGYLGSHIWSVGGEGDRTDVNVTNVQPFFSYTTRTATTIGAYTEARYDWKTEQWSVPLIVQAGQLFKVGSQIMQLAVGAKYWADAPYGGPEGWGLRVQLTFVFPR